MERAAVTYSITPHARGTNNHSMSIHSHSMCYDPAVMILYITDSGGLMSTWTGWKGLIRTGDHVDRRTEGINTGRLPSNVLRDCIEKTAMNQTSESLLEASSVGLLAFRRVSRPAGQGARWVKSLVLKSRSDWRSRVVSRHVGGAGIWWMNSRDVSRERNSCLLRGVAGQTTSVLWEGF